MGIWDRHGGGGNNHHSPFFDSHSQCVGALGGNLSLEAAPWEGWASGENICYTYDPLGPGMSVDLWHTDLMDEDCQVGCVQLYPQPLSCPPLPPIFRRSVPTSAGT